TRDCGGMDNAILFTTSPHLFKGAEVARFQAVQDRVKLFRYGIDCYAYALLAAGHVDIVIETVLKPYDVGALIPLIEQAGGVMTTWEGGRPEAGGRIIAAGSASLHAEALEMLNAA
ncbi:MAG: histidinol-phosphatase, partial [Rhizobium sp.]|nr:histidinol-phosphatase [Rhizobium sp.]